MEEIWYFSRNGEQFGPYTAAALFESYQSQQLVADDFVWREGLDNWIPIEQAMAAIQQVAAPEPSVPQPAVIQPVIPEPISASPHAASQSLVRGGATLAAVKKNPKVSPYGPYRNPGGLCTALTVTLGIYLVLGLISIVSSYLQYDLLSNYDAGAYSDEEYDELATANDAREALVGVGFLLILIVNVVIWCIWTNRIMKNSYSFGADWIRITPGWAVAWYFIPIANLFKPVQAINDAWRASVNPDRGNSLATPGLITAWWTFWLITNFLGNISFRLTMHADDVSGLISATVVAMIGGVVDVVLVVIAVSMVRKLTSLQQEKAAEFAY